jgi:hypothetical protein
MQANCHRCSAPISFTLADRSKGVRCPVCGYAHTWAQAVSLALRRPPVHQTATDAATVKALQEV